MDELLIYTQLPQLPSHHLSRDSTKWFQRQQLTIGRTVRSIRPANCCQLIPPKRFFDGFPDPSQFAAAKLTHYSSKPQRPSDSSRSWLRILLSGDVHPNPGPTTKYLCSGLQNAAEYRRIRDWVCSSCSSPAVKPQPLPPSIPTQAVDGHSFTIMQFNANGIDNKLTELGEFLERHNVKVAVIGIKALL